MRRIANSQSEEEFNVAVETLKDSVDWKENHKYVQYNIKSIHKKYASEVPRFLHCKPKVFVDHCLGRLLTPGHPTSISAEEVGPRKLKVTSYDSDSVYTVDLGQALPCCSCKDWLNTHWPCKHMLHVMINIPGNSWHTLSEDFINSPHLCCDSDMFVEGQVHDHASGDSPASAFANVSAKRKATLSMCSGGIINKKPVAIASTCKTLAASIRNMMFLVRDAADYEDIYVDLLLVHRNLASRIPAQSGLFLRPTIRGRRPSVLLNGSLKMRKKQSWKRKQVLKTAARVKHHVSSSLKVIPQDSVLTMSFNKTDADDLLKSGQQLMPGVGQQAKIPCDDCGRSYHFTNYCVEADFERLGDGERFRCTLCRMNYWESLVDQGTAAEAQTTKGQKVLAGHLPEGQKVLAGHLPEGQKVLAGHLPEGQKMLAGHLPESQKVLAGHLPEGQKVQSTPHY
ncbi:hypothetical protein MAR_007560 [Mya arenaria]|uniref:SWIM-type domain-containing protein n=1 Tax=Mya arenaria TaxID=6604 RepID=A0ABY7DF83_MYAAR|nr:hypothetical protein MAR_007560 [Mya arenaria]